MVVISVIFGENDFENERALARILADFHGEAVKVDGEGLELAQLPQLLMGSTLFAAHRLVVIKHLSANKPLWEMLEKWIDKVDSEDHLVLLDTKPDKRTKTFKALQKKATLYESKLWTERDTIKAEQWVGEEARRLGCTLDKKCIQKLVVWVGVDQWSLYHALEKLAVLEKVTPEIIEKVIEPTLSENAFLLFETALKGNGTKVMQALAVLEASEDPFRLFGLLSGQAFWLATISVANEPDAKVAADLGVHPFSISKLSPYAKKLGRKRVSDVLETFAQADTAMKSLGVDPWLLLERALMRTTKIVQ